MQLKEHHCQLILYAFRALILYSSCSPQPQMHLIAVKPPAETGSNNSAHSLMPVYRVMAGLSLDKNKEQDGFAAKEDITLLCT